MTALAESEAAGRLQRALETFQKVQGMLLTAHRRLKGLPAADVDQFWTVQGSRIEKQLHAAAVEVTAAFQAFSAAGLVASASDRHLIREAQRQLTEGGR
jgi:phosphoserine phosphatase